ncbi:MAG: hypothetical protein ACE5KX_05750 [Acidimicrobiia bacterium]
MVLLVTIEALAIALLGFLVAGLLRSHAEVLRALHDLGAGYNDDSGAALRVRPGVAQSRSTSTPAFDLVGKAPNGGSVKIGVVGTDHSTLLAFLSTGCQTCAGFWEAFGAGSGLLLPGEDTRLVIVTKGPGDESESRLRQLAPRDVPIVLSSQAWTDYEVPVSPYFILVDGPSSRVLGEGAATTWPRVASLLEQALADGGLGSSGEGGDVDGRRRRRRRAGAERQARADQELLAAGIHPGHPSLYPPAAPEPGQAED